MKILTKSVKILVGLVTGLLLAAAAVQVAPNLMEPVVSTAWAVSKKVRGEAPNCDWGAVAGFYGDFREFAERIAEHQEQLKIENYDKDADLMLLSHPTRNYWLPNREKIEEFGFAYTLAENDFLVERDPDKAVKPGDIVIDCRGSRRRVCRESSEFGCRQSDCDRTATSQFGMPAAKLSLRVGGRSARLGAQSRLEQ